MCICLGLRVLLSISTYSSVLDCRRMGGGLIKWEEADKLFKFHNRSAGEYITDVTVTASFWSILTDCKREEVFLKLIYPTSSILKKELINCHTLDCLNEIIISEIWSSENISFIFLPEIIRVYLSQITYFSFTDGNAIIIESSF